jgi:hypothetical protein
VSSNAAHLVPFQQLNLSFASSRENRAKHLARVAAEYMQLLYHVTKAQTEQSAFVDEIQWVCEPYRVLSRPGHAD